MLLVYREDFNERDVRKLIIEFEAIFKANTVNKNSYSVTTLEAAKMLNTTVDELAELAIFENIFLHIKELKNGDEVPIILKPQLCKIYVNQQLRKRYV